MKGDCLVFVPATQSARQSATKSPAKPKTVKKSVTKEVKKVGKKPAKKQVKLASKTDGHFIPCRDISRDPIVPVEVPDQPVDVPSPPVTEVRSPPQPVDSEPVPINTVPVFTFLPPEGLTSESDRGTIDTSMLLDSFGGFGHVAFTVDRSFFDRDIDSVPVVTVPITSSIVLVVLGAAVMLLFSKGVRNK
jgi:hypothetical protein